MLLNNSARKLFAFCAKLNLKVKIAADTTDSHYKNKTFYIPFGINGYAKSLFVGRRTIAMRNKKLFLDFLCHELGHYLVAPNGRRKLKDYGIPLERNRSDRSHAKWEFDEKQAYLIELLLKKNFGLTYDKKPFDRYSFYGDRKLVKWWKENENNFIKIILEANGKL